MLAASAIGAALAVSITTLFAFSTALGSSIAAAATRAVGDAGRTLPALAGLCNSHGALGSAACSSLVTAAARAIRTGCALATSFFVAAAATIIAALVGLSISHGALGSAACSNLVATAATAILNVTALATSFFIAAAAIIIAALVGLSIGNGALGSAACSSLVAALVGLSIRNGALGSAACSSLVATLGGLLVLWLSTTRKSAASLLGAQLVCKHKDNRHENHKQEVHLVASCLFMNHHVLFKLGDQPCCRNGIDTFG